MKSFRIRRIILPLLVLLAAVSTSEARAEAIGPGSSNTGRKVVYISTADQYISFVNAVNAGDYDLCAVLTADIDLDGKTVRPIGSEEHPYYGIFDGKGHIIKNMKIEMATNFVGMFGLIGVKAHICNFILDKPSFKGNYYVAAVADVKSGSSPIIENVGFNNGSVYAGNDNGAGIVGRSNGAVSLTVRNCFVTGKIEGMGSTSTLCGWNSGSTKFINCWNTATMTGGTGDDKKFTHNGILQNCRDNNAGNGLSAPDEAYYNALAATGSWIYDSSFGHIIPTVVNIDAELNAFLNEWADEWHKNDDFKTSLSDFKFVHTHGVVSHVNRGDGRAPAIKDWCDWDNCFDADGNWLLDVEELRKAGVAPPDFTFMTSKDDERIENGVRQRAHTDESVVYALPGDVVVLYPFREFYRTHGYGYKYYENYIRWYDYKTDGNNPYLDFYTDPEGIYKTDNIGYFGGKGMANIIPTAVHISTVDEYISFVNRVNAGENTLNAVLDADLDFEGRTDIKPIGIARDDCPYAGTFDGKGHTLSNLTIEMSGTDAVGMFGYVKGPAVIRNFKLKDAKFTGKQWTGVVGFNDTGVITIENIGFSGTSTANQNASGILGANNSYNKERKILIRNCYVTGSIKGGKESAAISGYAINADIVNCWSTATVTGADNPKNGMTYTFTRGYSAGYNVRLTNCYASDGGNNLPNTPADLNTQAFADALDNEYWKVSETDGNVTPSNNVYLNRLDKLFTPISASPSGKDTDPRTATVATFYVPENDKTFTKGKDVVIAADFSQTFIKENNIDLDNKIIYEPTIAFRRIFTIKNGATFAEDISGSVENNNKYIRKTRRHIKAPANKQFQIRLDFKMPKTDAGISNVYYKKAEGSYDRVHMFDIQVVDRNTGEVTNSVKFAGCGVYDGQGARDNVNIGDGGYQYYRGIRCEAANAKKGSYMVRLIAKDGNGNIINIAGTSTPLVIAEYELDFEDTTMLSFVDEQTLKNDPAYALHTDKYLEETYGKPYDVLDYDQYRVFETLSNPNNYLYTKATYSDSKHSKYIKWPKPWKRSTYGFGYNQRYDYNMYVYASHSSSTPYSAAADANTETDNFGIAKGLFDRRFYETGGKEQGYFGYSNAAADPGVIGNLYIDKICDGSTIYGTAWIAEFSNTDEVANVIINFNAELSDGTTHALKSVTTGYIPRDKLGKWMHLYFSFTPNLSKHGLDASKVVSYHVTIENNCMSSVGADYAIDDIRLYIVKPRASAQQSAPVCENDTRLKVKVEIPFEVMLASTGSVEAAKESAGETNYIYYSFIDKSKYEDSRKSGMNHHDSYEKAVLRYKYNMSGLTQRFGRFSFNSYYNANKPYAGPTDKVGQEAFIQTKQDTQDRMLVLNTYPKDDELKPGKEYILAFYPSAGSVVDTDTEVKNIKQDPSMYFDLEDQCAKFCVLKVLPSQVMKIDGVAVPDLNEITVCENHSPVVHIDIYGVPEDGSRSLEMLKENACLDWYSGSEEQYAAESRTVGGKKLTLSEAITAFRAEYPDADTWDCPAKGEYTEDMRQYLKEMTAVNSITHSARLTLYKSAYLFTPVKKDELTYVVAIPIFRSNEKWILCTDPVELKINVGERSPKLMHGLPVEYPADMDDVPLRIGINQIKKVSGESDALITGTFDTPTLNIPIRSVTPVTEGVTKLVRGKDVAVYLAETNDPEYSIVLAADADNTYSSLIEVGAIKDLVAVKDDSGNVIRLSFFNNFKFKEGYYYRLRFDFIEDESQVRLTKDVNSSTACSGQHVFTIKVVPEYMQWTGNAGNRNWNNDLNWRRVTSDELKRAKSDTDEFTTDGSNGNPFSYSPLDFTKAIIPAGIDSPYLFDVVTTGISFTEGGITETLEHYSTPKSPEAGDPTQDIEYDMAAKSREKSVSCGPWYAHTCDQIHFRPNAEIMNQQYLSYNRAWAEFELTPDRWYTLASPLKATVAGDMYLPKAGARQDTELFEPITFSTGFNDRFAPAVYQRAWNKATATVYEIQDGKSRNVAVKTVWSNVYNDVNEMYTAGTGFSINADVSRLTGASGKVLFRLPKDDASYSYYNEDGSIVGNNTSVDRTYAYKLNDVSGTIKVESAAPCRYFLVGNPFMAHIDMAGFLNANADKINPKYWVLTDGGYAAASKDDADKFTASIESPGMLAPMQGFFVETKNEETGVELTYTPDMLGTFTYDVDESPLPLHSPTRSEGHDGCLRITAMSDGEPVSQALIRIKPDAAGGYSEREDVAFLDGDDILSTAKIYTVAGNVAASINTMPEIGTTEIGLIADDTHAQTTLRFNGADCVEDAMLYDVMTGETTPIYEDMEYTVEGSATGRLFITASMPGIAERGIHITQSGNTVSVTSPLPVSVNVYDMHGLHILSRSAESGITSFTLDQGVYVIEACNNETVTRQKTAVR